jgi:hypothetical protein
LFSCTWEKPVKLRRVSITIKRFFIVLFFSKMHDV